MSHLSSSGDQQAVIGCHLLVNGYLPPMNGDLQLMLGGHPRPGSGDLQPKILALFTDG